MENNKKIYIVLSFTNTVVGRLICTSAKLNFWNRHPGDCYSHVSISLDPKLDSMVSFARKKLHNPFIAGLVKENIRTGVFALNPNKSNIALFEIPITNTQYENIDKSIKRCFDNCDELKYNFLSLITMLICGKGICIHNRYICTQWVAELLNSNEIYFFKNRKPKDIIPFDYYTAMKKYCIFEGNVTQYPHFNT